MDGNNIFVKGNVNRQETLAVGWDDDFPSLRPCTIRYEDYPSCDTASQPDDQVFYPDEYDPSFEPDPEASTDYPHLSWENPFAAQTVKPTTETTGIAMEILPGTYGRIAPRSGLALYHGIDVGAGVIDPDYRDEIKVLLFNHDKDEPFIVQPGDRIATFNPNTAIHGSYEIAAYDHLNASSKMKRKTV